VARLSLRYGERKRESVRVGELFFASRAVAFGAFRRSCRYGERKRESVRADVPCFASRPALMFGAFRVSPRYVWPKRESVRDGEKSLGASVRVGIWGRRGRAGKRQEPLGSVPRGSWRRAGSYRVSPNPPGRIMS
jgi:hypothetical protein